MKPVIERFIAEELQVDVRTVYRYIDTLCVSGYPNSDALTRAIGRIRSRITDAQNRRLDRDASAVDAVRGETSAYNTLPYVERVVFECRSTGSYRRRECHTKTPTADSLTAGGLRRTSMTPWALLWANRCSSRLQCCWAEKRSNFSPATGRSARTNGLA